MAGVHKTNAPDSRIAVRKGEMLLKPRKSGISGFAVVQPPLVGITMTRVGASLTLKRLDYFLLFGSPSFFMLFLISLSACRPRSHPLRLPGIQSSPHRTAARHMSFDLDSLLLPKLRSCLHRDPYVGEKEG